MTPTTNTILTSLIFMMFTFSLASLTFAQEDNFDSLPVAEQIAALLEILADLQEQLRVLQGGDTTYVFQRDLKLGDEGADVLALQKELNSNPATVIAESGPGSPGNETTYFGFLTLKAVMKFQELHRAEILTPNDLVRGTGYFGQSTRAKLNARRLSSNTSLDTQSTSDSAANTTSSVDEVDSESTVKKTSTQSGGGSGRGTTPLPYTEPELEIDLALEPEPGPLSEEPEAEIELISQLIEEVSPWDINSAYQTKVIGDDVYNDGGTGSFVEHIDSTATISAGDTAVITFVDDIANDGIIVGTAYDYTGFVNNTDFDFGVYTRKEKKNFYTLRNGSLTARAINGGRFTGAVIRMELDTDEVRYYYNDALVATDSNAPVFPYKVIGVPNDPDAIIRNAQIDVARSSVTQSVAPKDDSIIVPRGGFDTFKDKNYDDFLPYQSCFANFSTVNPTKTIYVSPAVNLGSSQTGSLQNPFGNLVEAVKNNPINTKVVLLAGEHKINPQSRPILENLRNVSIESMGNAVLVGETGFLNSIPDVSVWQEKTFSNGVKYKWHRPTKPIASDGVSGLKGIYSRADSTTVPLVSYDSLLTLLSLNEDFIPHPKEPGYTDYIYLGPGVYFDSEKCKQFVAGIESDASSCDLYFRADLPKHYNSKDTTVSNVQLFSTSAYLSITNSEQVAMKNLTFSGFGPRIRDSKDIAITGNTFKHGSLYIENTSKESTLTKGIVIENNRFVGGVADYFYWSDLKHGPSASFKSTSDLPTHGGNQGPAWRHHNAALLVRSTVKDFSGMPPQCISIHDNFVSDSWFGIYTTAGNDIFIYDNVLQKIKDDAVMYHKRGVEQIYTGFNVVRDSFNAFSQVPSDISYSLANRNTLTRKGRFTHNNIVESTDLSKAPLWNRKERSKQTGMAFFVGHNSNQAPGPWEIYNNTVVSNVPSHLTLGASGINNINNIFVNLSSDSYFTNGKDLGSLFENNILWKAGAPTEIRDYLQLTQEFCENQASNFPIDHVKFASLGSVKTVQLLCIEKFPTLSPNQIYFDAARNFTGNLYFRPKFTDTFWPQAPSRGRQFSDGRPFQSQEFIGACQNSNCN